MTVERDLGRMEGKVDALLREIRDERMETRAYRADFVARFESIERRTTVLEDLAKEVKWTVRGVMLAWSAVGAAVSAGAIFIWKWVTETHG